MSVPPPPPPGASDKADATDVVRDAQWRDLLRFLPDVGRLLAALAKDPRVPWYAKAAAGGAVAYVVSPLDFVPDFIPVVGRADDLFVVVRALRFLFDTAGHDLLRELWTGSEDGFALLLVLTGVGR